jgi:hypothetical protein
LTKEEAAQRTLERIGNVKALDLTQENPLNEPLASQDVARPQKLDPETVGKKQVRVAFKQSLEKGKALRDANPPKAPESPGKKLERITRGEAR